jgi:two-component system response regulator WspF
MNIAIVNNQPAALATLRQVLAQHVGLNLIWEAHDGAQAIAACASQCPDVLLLDLDLPHIDGVAATRAIMRSTPCAILIVTHDVGAIAARVYDALGCGALDAVNTPHVDSSGQIEGASTLLARIDLIGKRLDERATPREKVPERRRSRGARRLVAVGASAGGPSALATLLGGLPADFDAAMVIVQHIDASFTPGMASWLASHCALPVRLLEEGDYARAGEVLIAGSNRHVLFLENHRFGYSVDLLDSIYCPSIDVFFESVARHWRGEVTGVLLTGMGRDGAAGLKALRDRGHHTIAQDSTTSAVYGMPKAAVALNAAVDVLPLDAIAARLSAAQGTLFTTAIR